MTMRSSALLNAEGWHTISSEDIVLHVNPGQSSLEGSLAICTRQKSLTNDLLNALAIPIFAPDSFRCGSVLTASNRDKVTWVPFTAQAIYDIELHPSKKKCLLLEPHAVDKTLLRCVWILQVRKHPKWSSIPVVNFSGSPSSLLIRSTSYLVALEGRPDRLYYDRLCRRVNPSSPPTLLMPKDAPVETSTVRARALLGQTHEALLETIKALIPRQGRMLVLAEEPLRTMLNFLDVFMYQLARLPQSIPLLIYGQNVRRMLALLDSHFYFQNTEEAVAGPPTSELCRYRQSLLERLRAKQLEIVDSPQEMCRRIAKGSVVVFVIADPKHLVQSLNELASEMGDMSEPSDISEPSAFSEASNESGKASPARKGSVQLWSAEAEHMDWRWTDVARTLIQHPQNTAVVRFRRSQMQNRGQPDEDLQADARKRVNIIDLLLPNPLEWLPVGGIKWRSEAELEPPVREVDVSVAGKVIWPLTMSKDVFVGTLTTPNLILSAPKVTLVHLNQTLHHEFVDAGSYAQGLG